MILYLDTSAFIKLYVDESDARAVRTSVAGARRIYSHWITYPEMRSALARLHRMGRQTDEGYRERKQEFETDWLAISTIMPDERLFRRAGEFTERYGLRGYDALHLAAAESVSTNPNPGAMVFASFDQSLNREADSIGLRLLVCA